MAKEKDMQATAEKIKDPLSLKRTRENLTVQIDSNLYDEALKYRDKYGYSWRSVVENGLEHFIEVCKRSDLKKGG